MEGENRNFLIPHMYVAFFFPPCVCSREGRTNAHVKGDYQRIGDVMLRNMRILKVDTGLKTWNFGIIEGFFYFVLSRIRAQG